MIVVDVETSGTNPEKHSILSIGAVDLDQPKSQFYVECKMWNGAHVDPEALVVNGFVESEIIADESIKKSGEGEAVSDFFKWLDTRDNVLLAAQNPIFDLGFLHSAATRQGLDIRLAHRSIDLHTVAYSHMVGRGLNPPTKNKKSDINSDYIMEYVGIPAEPRPHRAINGAIWEAEALSRLLYNKNLLEQFEKYPLVWDK